MTREQHEDWAQYIETLWESLAKRASSASGGNIETAANVWGNDQCRPHYLEVETTSLAFNLRANPLILVEQLESFSSQLRREVTAAMAAGKFDYRPISSAERIKQLIDARAAR